MLPRPAPAAPAAGWELGSPVRDCGQLTALLPEVAVSGPAPRELARARICAICSLSAAVPRL
eukprot:7004741-Heterocapsa_arctica.AAC.1